MARDVGVRVEGASRLRRTLKAAAGDLGDLKAAHAKAAKVAETAAAGLAPVLSGALKASLRSSGTAREGVIRAGKASVPYAAPIHWGWAARGIEPQPFISEGAQVSEPVWLRVFEEDLDKILDQVKGL